MKDQAADKRSLIIAGALVLTVVFLGVFSWLLASTVMPTGCRSGMWLLDRLNCLAPNELGDTFAGAFAPVAFVWLVAAVMLQRNELAAQRQELRESREVSVQQVAEARKNVELISEQTAMLKNDRERIQQREADEDIDEMVSILVAQLREYVNHTYISEFAGVVDQHGNLSYDAQVWVQEGLGGDYAEMDRYSTALIDLVTQAGNLAREDVEFHHSGVYPYKIILDYVEQIQKLARQASPPKRALLNLRGFDRLQRYLPKLIELIETHGSKDDDIPF